MFLLTTTHRCKIISKMQKTLRELIALRALPVYPVFVDENSNGADEKIKITGLL